MAEELKSLDDLKSAVAGAEVPAEDRDPLFRESFRRVVLRR